MSLHVLELDDPDAAYEQARDFLFSRPVAHNVLLTVLGQSRELSIAGRFWIARDDAHVVGFAMQSPPGMRVGLAQMDDDASRALAEAIPPSIPGVLGVAAVTSTFAGHFAQCHRVPATADDAGRLYELGRLTTVATAPGAARLATLDDRPTLLEWSRDFAGDTTTRSVPTPEMFDRLIAGGQWWVWDDGGAVSMARASAAPAGVARVQHVYTPAERRGKGYATACVEHLSRALTDRGLRCILYPQLNNPTSNAIYQRLGYVAVAEVLSYEFG
jgi:GNAT superfamily N-acetyltransferase